MNQRAKNSDARLPGRQRILVWLALLAVAALVAQFQWGALASARDTNAIALRQLEQMQADAAAINRLNLTPKSAVGRTRPNDELLAQIEKAVSVAGIERSQWHDSVPQSPSRRPQSEYIRHTTNVYLEEITLAQLTAMAHYLVTNDPTLTLSSLRLTSRHADRPSFDVDLGVSYRVYAPRGDSGATDPM